MKAWPALAALALASCVLDREGLTGDSQMACTPGKIEPCDYGGPSGTDGAGICRAATKTCKADGSGYGLCGGAVLPAPYDDCDTDEDESCDGEANEGCVCKSGETTPCYGGPEGTLDVGACKSGVSMCQRGEFGVCEGDVQPAGIEDCVTGQDQDCDGVATSCSGELSWGALIATSQDDPTGKPLWIQTFGPADHQVGRVITADRNANVLIAGYCKGGVALAPQLPSNSWDAFVGKLAP